MCTTQMSICYFKPDVGTYYVIYLKWDGSVFVAAGLMKISRNLILMRFEHAIIEHDKNLQNEHPNWDILPTPRR